ncbi:MAG TPA: RNA 2',3'-cyclic phosphodiesterase, partial [Pelomicrobium sp.]|nr:RNA 2',3'-cyclic phosphodiesterase [Pelomicrobium sp.]
MSGGPRPLRVFFALWPDASTRRALDQAACAIHSHCGGRAMRAPNIHLTLVFVGDVPALRLPELCAAAAAVEGAAVDMIVDRAVFWPRQRIAWVGPAQTPAALAQLVAALEERLAQGGFAFDRRPYLPHVTLVRNA